MRVRSEADELSVGFVVRYKIRFTLKRDARMITRADMKHTGCFLLGIVLWLFLSWTGTAGTLTSQEGTEFSVIAQSQEELDAFNAVVAETDPTSKLLLAEGFLSEYPDSELTHQVLSMRLQSHVDLENHRLVIEAAETALAAERAFQDAKRAQFPGLEAVPGYAAFRHESMIAERVAYQSLMNAHRALGDFASAAQNGEFALEVLERDWEEFSPTLYQVGAAYDEALQNHRQNQLFYFQVIMDAYQRLDNATKAVEYGQRSLALDPENLLTLITVSSVMAERPPADEDERESHFALAEQYAESALDSLQRFLAGPGAQTELAERASLLSAAHSTLGLVYLSQDELADAQDEYRRALEAVPDDPVAYFRLGEAYVQDGKPEEAIESLARSVYLKGVTEQLARDLLERVYELENESQDGLEEFIQREGQEIGSNE